MATVTITTSIDAWIGSTTVTTTMDALIQKSTTKTTTLDAYISKLLSTTLDAYIVEARGSFRGTMVTSDRNALTAVQVGDTIINVDSGTNKSYQEYWNGTAWIQGATIAAPNSGMDNKTLAPGPVTSQYSVQTGDATYPLRYGNPPLRKVSADTSGGFWAQAMGFASGVSALNADESITLAARAGYQTPTLVQSAIGSGTTTATATWSTPTTAGNTIALVASASNTISTPSGYTLAISSTGTGLFEYIFYKENCNAGEGNPSVTAGFGQNPILHAMEWSGLLASSSLDATSHSELYVVPKTLSTDTTGTTASTTQAVEVAIAGISIQVRTGVLPYQLVSQADYVQVGNTTSPDALKNLTSAYAVIHARGTQSFATVLGGDLSVLYNGVIATFKAAPIAITTPAAKTLNLRADDNAGVSALYYRDDAGVDHLVADSASLTALAKTFALSEVSAFTDVLSYLATRIRFLEQTQGIEVSDLPILAPDGLDFIDEQTF